MFAAWSGGRGVMGYAEIIAVAERRGIRARAGTRKRSGLEVSSRNRKQRRLRRSVRAGAGYSGLCTARRFARRRFRKVSRHFFRGGARKSASRPRGVAREILEASARRR